MGGEAQSLDLQRLQSLREAPTSNLPAILAPVAAVLEAAEAAAVVEAAAVLQA